MKKQILTILCLLVLGTASASHIIGGEIFYDYLGNNTYQVTLKLYRNCNQSCTECAPYANPEYVTIFDESGNIFTQLAMPLPPVSTLPATYVSPCFVLPEECVQEADYTAQVVLPVSAGGYTIVYQRCCRTLDLNNLEANQGATYTAGVPGSALAAGNSSARFDSLPPQYVCLNTPLSLSYAATDPDGDSLVYNLCDPYQGADGNCPDPVPNSGQPGCPTAPNAPPYSAAIYTSPYADTNFTNTPPSSANFTINPNTGLLTGTPNTEGIFDITVCVSEYRQGQLLNTLRRDFQLTVTACSVPIISLPAQQSQCSRLTANFTSLYYDPTGNISFLWNFGVPGLTGDTSVLASPSYTYPDSGTYTVKLIANTTVDGQPCIDTANSIVKVYPTFTDAFTIPNSACIDSPVVFTSQTVSTSGAVDSLIWNFGDSATSAQPSTTHIYTVPGSYYATLYEQNTAGCFQTVTQYLVVSDCVTGILNVTDPNLNIHLYPNPANNSTTLYYSPFAGQHATLNIYNQLGQLVKQQLLPAGANSQDIKTDQLQEGVYTYSFILNDRTIKRDKFIVAR